MTHPNFPVAWDMFPLPCYDPQEKYGECPPTFLDLLNDERVPIKDKIWAFSKCTEIPDNIKRMFSVRCIRETPISNGKFVFDLLTDPRSIRAVEVAEAYAKGFASDDELKAARDAAWYAARDAAWYAAGNAAWDAARDAARDAAGNAAWDAARGFQLSIIKSMIVL